MADELSPYALAPVKSQALQGVGYSPAFLASDAFTLKHEGGATRNDGIGHTANQGIDQNAHPEVNVLSMTPEQTQAMRYKYWTAVNGDALAQKDPRLALIAYETAIASGPGVANHLLAQSGGDAGALMALRVNFMQGLVARDPQKYGPVAQGWANRNRDLAQAAGLDPTKFGLPAGNGAYVNWAGPSLVDDVSKRMGPLTGVSSAPSAPPAPEQPQAAAPAPAPNPVALPQLQPMQMAAAAPAANPQVLYLDLLKQKQAV